MGNIWWNYIRTTVFNDLRKYMKSVSTAINCTTKDQSANPVTKFPTVFFQEIESPFIYDLTHKDVVGMRHYLRLYVFSNESTDECADIRAEAVDFLVSKYGYNVTLLPITFNGDYYTGIAQLNRVIGGGEKIAKV